MNIIEASKKCDCKQKLQRKEWGDSMFLENSDGYWWIVYCSDDPNDQWAPHHLDLIAEDWKVID